MKNLIKPLVCALALSVPAFASAGVNSVQVSETEVRISYNSYDLKNTSSRDELERMIRNSAKKVCGYNHLRQVGSIRQFLDARTCYEKSVAEAMRSIRATG